MSNNQAIAWATIALVLATLALVAATALLTRNAGRANRDAARPHLVLSLHALGARHRTMRVSNIGLGSARHARGRLTLHGADGSSEVRDWHEHVIEPGDRHDYLPPRTVPNLDFDKFAEQYPVIELDATMRDTFGREHSLHDAIDVKAYAEQFKQTHERVPDDYEKRTVDALESIAKTLEWQRHFTGQAGMAEGPSAD